MIDKDRDDEVVKDDYAAMKEQELREQEANVTKAEAHAREAKATEQLKELSGLRDLQQKARAFLNRFTAATSAERERIRSEFEESRKRFVGQLDAINKRLDRIDEVREDKLNAQLDQLDAEIVELDAKVENQAIVLDMEAAAEIEAVHQELADAQEKRRQVATAREESAQEVIVAFKQTIDHLQHTWQHARERVETARHA